MIAAILLATTLHWKIEGVQREAIVYAPRSKRPLPVVFVFHPHGGTAVDSARLMHFQKDWPDAIVVYPQGLNTATPRDPAGLRPGWQREAGELGNRDLEFFDAMLETLRKDHIIDPHRIYAAGFSNGATFTFLLWAERADVVSGFAVCAGALLPTVQPREPRPIIHIAGRADEIAKFELQAQSIKAEHALNDPTSVPVREVIHDGGHIYPATATRDIVRFLRELPPPRPDGIPHARDALRR